MSSIEAGQVYVAVKASASMPGEHRVRIRVKRVGSSHPGGSNFSQAYVASLTASGFELRHRWISTSQLHASATTRDGQPRRTGYVLEVTR